MVVEELDEPIRVRADFSAGAVTPKAFRRGTQLFHVEHIHARWEDRLDAAKRYHFSIESGGNLFEIHLDSRDMSWRLDRVCLEG